MNFNTSDNDNSSEDEVNDQNDSDMINLSDSDDMLSHPNLSQIQELLLNSTVGPPPTAAVGLGLMSFLEADHNSFLTPWNWKPAAAGEETLEPASDLKIENSAIVGRATKEYVMFQPGSFFAHEVHDFVMQEQQPADDSSDQLQSTDNEL